jgi:hypothetical protein
MSRRERTVLRENNKLHEKKVMKQHQHELGNKLVVVAGGAGDIGERITRMFLQRKRAGVAHG